MSAGTSPEHFRFRDRGRHRRKLQRCLDALARMLADETFSFPRRHIGLELELNLIDKSMRPSMINTMVLGALDDPAFTFELSQHNIELNVPPRPLAGDSAVEMETDVETYLRRAASAAADAGATVAMIGILPTLTQEHFDIKWLTSNARYAQLGEEIFAARGEQLTLAFDGTALRGHQPERLRAQAQTILPEAACTSVQLHVQAAPEEFAAHWNAAQCLAGPQAALGANSPFLLGKALWHETRIPLFLQATDTRPAELTNQGVRPRVWFGERWITSIFDLFEENVRYFPALVPGTETEDPMEMLEAGLAPHLSELCAHNGTIWRWNRPVYDGDGGVPHLRVENRVLPAGPTVIDMMANAAFFYGAQRALAEAERPIWTQMSFAAAEDNLYACARNGLASEVYWPGVGWTPADELVLRVLLPLAHEGLRAAQVSETARDRYLGVIEQRCVTQRTGAVWQRETVAHADDAGLDRDTALVRMLHRYQELSASGEPVHTWPVGS